MNGLLVIFIVLHFSHREEVLPIEKIITKETGLTVNYTEPNEKIIDLLPQRGNANKRRQCKLLFDKIAFKKFKNE